MVLEIIYKHTCKVMNGNSIVAISLPLAPQQQRILCRLLLTALVVLIYFYLDFLDLEPEDDRPDKAKDQSGIPVHDIFCADAL